jgi:membrane protein insertase Oxa1/YidC/SpoIIIJ
MMTYFLPAIFGFMSIQWAPSILIYWITFSIAQVGESKLILRRLRPVPSTISSDVERPKEMKELDSIVREDKAKTQPSKKEKKQVTEESQMRKQKEGGKKKSGGTKEKK